MLLDRYKYKIHSLDDLSRLIDPKTRKQKVVLCHGVFDIVHPGHIRHLISAKEQAEILVAGITSDRFVSKTTYSPHIPQDMRALNLAALEIVDYVIINDQPNPHDLLLTLQPDFYAKGFEYSAVKRPEQPIAEEAVVLSYGGKVIYTPGDFVRSSSAIMSSNGRPDLRFDKLRLVMNRDGISFDDIRALLPQFEDIQVHVVGDMIVDSYIYSTVIGGQTKTPTLSAVVERSVDYVGGAGVVARHLRSAGARVTLSTVLGNDPIGRWALGQLEADQVEVQPLMDGRPTTVKQAMVVGGYRLLKLDIVDNRSISNTLLANLSANIRECVARTVVFSDFRHGIFNARTIPALISAIPEGVMRVADSQVATRWGNITDFKNFDLITPNEREARFALADQDSGIRQLCADLYDKSQCKVLILKLGERGAMICDSPQHDNPTAFLSVDSFVDQLVDPVGAGDAMLTYATLALRCGARTTLAAILGSFAAAIACESDGNVPVTIPKVNDKISWVEERT